MVALAADLERSSAKCELSYHHLILGECTGLVGTDGGRRTKGFHCWQAPDKSVTADHLAHSEGEIDSDYGWQTFGNSSDGETHGDEEHLDEGNVTQQAHHEHETADGQSSPAQQFPELVQAYL